MATTRKQFLDDFLVFVAAREDASARNRAERALTRAVDLIWARHPWQSFQSSQPYQFTTVVGQRGYALPPYFGHVFSQDGAIRNVTARSSITPIDAFDLASRDPTQGTTGETAGTPSRYYLAGAIGVAAQPSSAGEEIEAVSSSDADTTVELLAEGLTSDGAWDRTQVVLNGQTPVSLGTWTRLQTVGKSAPEGTDPTTEGTTSAGTVTVRTVLGQTTLVKLLPDEAAIERTELALYPIPNVTHVIAVPMFRRPRPLRYDADVLPTGWDNALVEAMTIEWRLMGGDLQLDTDVPRPRLTDLICEDNMKRPRSARIPWTG